MICRSEVFEVSKKGNWYLISGGYLVVVFPNKVRDGSYKYSIKWIGVFEDQDGETVWSPIWYDNRLDAASAALVRLRGMRSEVEPEPASQKVAPQRRGPRGSAGWQTQEGTR